MKIIISFHAVQRMEERNISQDEVENAIRHPDKLIESFRERKIAVKNFDLGDLQVIYKEELDQIVVITVIR
jgi:hypothetical protein